MEGDTIAAVASAPGVGAVGVIRLSGADSLPILEAVFRPSGGGPLVPRQMTYGRLTAEDGSLIDLCMAVFFRGPKSYTGEDSAELFCHGGPAVLSTAMEALIRAGARAAGPGEYTRRAFINGKLDLAQAEAVVDLIAAETEAAVKNAAALLAGEGSGEVVRIRRLLINLLADFYAEVDFPDEGVPPLMPQAAREMLGEASGGIERMLAGSRRSRVLKEGTPVALVGPPNAGKSSLLNALCGSERAIVTEIAGTTRDVIEERFVCGGRVFRLIDTAGLRETEDEVERIGVARARKAAEEASLLLLLSDQSVPRKDEPSFPEGKKIIRVATKTDLPHQWSAPEEWCPVSARTGEGLSALCSRILAETEGESPDRGQALITNPRQIAALTEAARHIHEAEVGADAGMTFDVLACEVEAAAAELGALTGENVSDDVVQDIFSRFCVGK